MNGRDDRIDDRVRILYLRCVLLETKLNLSFLIDGGGTRLIRTQLGRGVDPNTIQIPPGAEMRSGSTDTTAAGPA